MKRTLQLATLLCLLLPLAACEGGTDKVDAGGVILSVTRFDGLPVQWSVNAGGPVVIEEIDITNVPKNPSGVTSDLMNVEIRSYEVTFTRGDTGTRIPSPLVRGLFGVAPVGGVLTIEGLPVADAEQLENVPLSDLLFENGGIDSETGDDSILINCRLRFFGRTLSGDEVETAPSDFTIRFEP